MRARRGGFLRGASVPIVVEMRVRSQPHLSTGVALLIVGFLLLFPFNLFLPTDEEPPTWTLPHLDKLVHFCLFLGLVPFVRRSLTALRPKRATAEAFLASSAYGAILEVLQRWIPGRDATWADAAANVLGAACATIGLLGWLRSR